MARRHSWLAGWTEARAAGAAINCNGELQAVQKQVRHSWHLQPATACWLLLMTAAGRYSWLELLKVFPQPCPRWNSSVHACGQAQTLELQHGPDRKRSGGAMVATAFGHHRFALHSKERERKKAVPGVSYHSTTYQQQPDSPAPPAEPQGAPLVRLKPHNCPVQKLCPQDASIRLLWLQRCATPCCAPCLALQGPCRSLLALYTGHPLC